MSPLAVEVAAGPIAIVRLEGDVDLANIPAVSAGILDAMGNAALGCVIDLSKVRYLDSAGVHMLFELARRFDVCRQAMALVLPEGSPLRTLLKIAHVHEAASIHAATADALAAIASTDY